MISNVSSAFVNSSALQCFKRRIAYANTSFDRILSLLDVFKLILYFFTDRTMWIELKKKTQNCCGYYNSFETL